MAAQDYEQAFNGSPDGGMLGSATTEKVGFHGTAPTAQRSGAAQAALTVATLSLGGYGWATQSGAEAAHALLVEIRAALVAKGLIKGSS
jgi:hypothetical protein